MHYGIGQVYMRFCHSYWPKIMHIYMATSACVAYMSQGNLGNSKFFPQNWTVSLAIATYYIIVNFLLYHYY